MRNRAFHISGKRGIVRPGQFGNGPLPNSLLEVHWPFEMSRVSAIGWELNSNGVPSGVEP